jgi:hypothetical protein
VIERYRTRSKNDCWAEVDTTAHWMRTDFAYLGLICYANNKPFAWAWHADGRSIDTADPVFDLIDFPKVDIGEAWRCTADAA